MQTTLLRWLNSQALIKCPKTALIIGDTVYMIPNKSGSFFVETLIWVKKRKNAKLGREEKGKQDQCDQIKIAKCL